MSTKEWMKMRWIYALEGADAIKQKKVSPQSQLFHPSKQSEFVSMLSILLLFLSIILWLCSLQHENVQNMNDLGMISTFPPSFIIALVCLVLSFCLNLLRRASVPMLMLQLFLLILMLYGIQNIVEEAPRFNIVYRHAGYTEYIMRTGSLDPYLDAYFNWPGFFVLSALVTQLAGYHSILSYAGWAPLFYNLIYAGPMYMLFTTASTNKRLVWLGLLFFYLTNWIGQDYFSPQGLNFFLYLVVIAVLVRWFKPLPGKTSLMRSFLERQRNRRAGGISWAIQYACEWLTTPDRPCTSTELSQRRVMLVFILIIFVFIAYSHPLTPIVVVVSAIALVLFRRCTPLWLPFFMATIVVLWDIFMAHPFLAGHTSWVFSTFGNVTSNVSAGVVQRATAGNVGHSFIALMCVVMTALIWLLACLGIIRRMRSGHRDITYILLLLAPFPLILANQYGGEMFMRIYFFTLPLMVFFAAALFCTPTIRLSTHGTSSGMKIATICTALILLSVFLFARYGNERENYMTYKEVAGIRYLYSVARPGSLFIGLTADPPWQFEDYEKYACVTLQLEDNVTSSAHAILLYIENQKAPFAYVIFTRSEEAAAEEGRFPPGTLDRLRNALLSTGEFKTIYSNSDAHILVFVGKPSAKKGTK